MSLDIGINFRQTSGYVTDGAGETYCTADSYPTTRGGVTFGWSAAATGVNRNSGIDRRFAGLNYRGTNGSYFQLDLPNTGTYDIYLAAGDYSGSNIVTWSLRDDSTEFASTTASTSAADRFKDALNTEHTAAAWPGSNTKATRAFGSTTFKLVNAHVGGFDCVVAHIRAVEVVLGNPHNYYAQIGLLM